MKLVLVWTPFMILWTLFMMTYTDFGLVGSLLSGIVNTAAAAIPAIGIWHLTRAIQWPDSVKPMFYSVHIGIGSLFAGLWTLTGGVAAPLYSNVTFAGYFSNPGTVLWRLLMGLFIYGCIAGMCYAARNYDRLRLQTIEMHRVEALAAKAELSSLRSRLSPHFIFNALHSISALMTRDVQQAELAIERLGHLLRFVLQEKEERFIPLRDEWAFTRDYFELENMRLENRVELVSRMDEQALGVDVPPLLLQPLVENSMKHGGFGPRRGGRIEVRAGISGDVLHLGVEDNGSGSNAKPEARRVGFHDGLSTLEERLAIIYGGRASLEIEDLGASGFRVQLAMPVSTGSRSLAHEKKSEIGGGNLLNG